MSKTPPFTVIIDTKEQKPLEFKNAEATVLEGIERKKLDTGDYSIKGLEDIVCIERKATVAEIAKNVTQDRFDRELKRMLEYKYRFLICEFSWSDVARYPNNLNLSAEAKKARRVKGPFVRSKICDYALDYNIQVLCCSSRNLTDITVWELLKKIARKEL